MHVSTFRGRSQRLRQLTASCVFLVLAGGCVTNHPFERGAELDVPSLVNELETKKDEDEALFDLTYVPLAHLDLQLFAANEDTERYPEGHAFVSMRSWLPLFGVVDADIELYDEDHSAYEKKEVTSVLWGLWTRERDTVQTGHGERTSLEYSVLWFLDWGPRVHYSQAQRPSEARLHSSLERP